MLGLKQTWLLLYTHFTKERNVGNYRNIWPEVGHNHSLQETGKARQMVWKEWPGGHRCVGASDIWSHRSVDCPEPLVLGAQALDGHSTHTTLVGSARCP